MNRKDEDLTQTKKNIKNTKFYEMDQEMKIYKDELIRLRYLLEMAYSGNMQGVDGVVSGRPSINAFTTPLSQSPFLNPPPQSQNQSQPAIMNAIASQAGHSMKLASNSQSNFFPEASNTSQNM